MLPKNARILVVDDKKLIRELLSAYLVAAGYTVILASDGAEAWEELNSDPEGFDVVLLDRRMPKMNGMEVMARMKDHPVLADIPVILQTAADSKQDISDGIRAGAYYYLTKPIERELLLSLTAAAIDDVNRYNGLRNDVRKHTQALTLMTSGSFKYQTLEEADYLAVALASTCPKQRSAVVGLSELLVNAIEHGNLGITYTEKEKLISEKRWTKEINTRLALPKYRSKFATVDFKCSVNKVVFTIRDQGKGFDWRRYMDFNPSRIFDNHGRGIAFACKFSFDKVEYRGNGNEVEATVTTSSNNELPQPNDPPLSLAPSSPPSLDVGYERFRARMEDELGVAKKMQEELLPSSQRTKVLEDKYGLSLSAYFETSFELGGDMWGAIALDDDRLAVYVVDFSGHGVAAALNTFRLHCLIREIKTNRENPGLYLQNLNDPLVEMLPVEQFATMLYGVIDITADKFTYATAGSPQPILAKTDSGETLLGEGRGLPLGIAEGAPYQNQSLPFHPGSLILLYSDALIESPREEGDRIGNDAVLDMVANKVDQLGEDTNAEAILDPFFAQVNRPLADDLTVVCCMRKSSS